MNKKNQGIKSEAMLKKLKELNSQVPEDKQLTDDQLANLPKVALEEVSIYISIVILCRRLNLFFFLNFKKWDLRM